MIIVITHEKIIDNEIVHINNLFENGLQILHLRKPGLSVNEYECIINGIQAEFRERVVLHEHYELALKYGLKGIHISFDENMKFKDAANFHHISVSCHTIEEVTALNYPYDYVFLSPVFDSISKENYLSKFKLEELQEFLLNSNQKIVALGGLDNQNYMDCLKVGFFGGAFLGYIWEDAEKSVQNYLRIFPTPVLSIAGFDPSSGAGITSDIKTFENCEVYGLGVCSGITFQNQNEYTGTIWTGIDDIKRQCELLFKEFNPPYVKIGLIESYNVLLELVKYLKKRLPKTKIIWDPILKASAGFDFHEKEDYEPLFEVLDLIYLMTPNSDEVKNLFGDDINFYKLENLCIEHNLNVLWKGRKDRQNVVTDYLVTPLYITYFSVTMDKYGKHGTGCVLSSAIASYLTNGFTLEDSCRKGQQYITSFIRSNDTNLGVHKGIEQFGKHVNLYDYDVQYITDYNEFISIPEQVERVCKGGIRWIQLRMKNTRYEEFVTIGKEVKEICRKYNAIFIVNDNIEIALELDADGIHLGKDDINPKDARKVLGFSKIIGCTCNSYEDIERSYQAKADYVGLGPYSFTTTKKVLSPILGIEGLNDIMEKCHENNVSIPIHVIGGIKMEDIEPILKTGVSGIAVSSLINKSEDMSTQSSEIISQLNKIRDNETISNCR